MSILGYYLFCGFVMYIVYSVVNNEDLTVDFLLFGTISLPILAIVACIWIVLDFFCTVFNRVVYFIKGLF